MIGLCCRLIANIDFAFVSPVHFENCDEIALIYREIAKIFRLVGRYRTRNVFVRSEENAHESILNLNDMEALILFVGHTLQRMTHAQVNHHGATPLPSSAPFRRKPCDAETWSLQFDRKHQTTE
jgi:hypothetical protein